MQGSGEKPLVKNVKYAGNWLESSGRNGESTPAFWFSYLKTVGIFCVIFCFLLRCQMGVVCVIINTVIPLIPMFWGERREI